MDARQEAIDILVKNESNPMSVEDATRKVDTAISKIATLMADESQEARDKTLLMKVRNVATSMNVAKFRGVCVAVGDKRDILEFSKKQAMAAYKENPRRAVAEGMVRIDGDKVIPIDTKKYFDAAGTKPNRGYGKPIGTVMRIESYFIIEKEDGTGVFTRVNGEFDSAQIGMMYEIFGIENDRGMINVPREPGIRAVGAVDSTELWNVTLNAANNSDAAVNLEDLPSVDKYSLVIASGLVRHQQPTVNGHMLVIEDDGNYETVCFCSGVVAEVASNVAVGNEIIAIGKATRNINQRTNQEQTNIYTMGVIVNPESGTYVRVMKDLDDVFIG